MMLSTILFTAIFSVILSKELPVNKSLAIETNSDTLRIVVLGSSTAAGSGPLNPNNAWVNRYRSYLQNANQNSEVINLAMGGYTTYKIMPNGFVPPPTKPSVDPNRNISKALSLNPTAIIINMPSNDATLGFSVTEQLANYDSILSVALIQNVPVWISTTQPRNLIQSGRDNLMEMRDSTFARFGEKAIDFWYGLAECNGKIKPEYDSGDGVHLNDSAHKILFERVQISGVGLSKFVMQLLHPQDGAILMGMEQIIWSPLLLPDTIYITTIDISNDGGTNWDQVLISSSDDTTFLWDTSFHPDGTRYKVRVVSLGNLDIGIAQSQGTFTINNPGNAVPEIEILSPIPGDILEGATEINWLAMDADADPLNIFLEISLDGTTWVSLADSEPNDGQFTWQTELLANSSHYYLKLKCTDGTEWVEVIVNPITIQNQTGTIPGSNINHVSGYGDGLITARIINTDSLTGHDYRITFDDTTSEITTYSVIDIFTGFPVVVNATELDGQTEGPLFDGLRLLIFNYVETLVDLTLTGWRIGTSTIGSQINNGTGSITGIPYAADYEISIFDHIVDTSSAFIGLPEIPINFLVNNITEGHGVDVVFVEQDNNQSISPNDQIFILEFDDNDNQFLTWLIRFTGNDSSVVPSPGDVFLLKTLKPFSVNDVFEFTSNISGMLQSDRYQTPSKFNLFQNYPNPFNPNTIIEFTIPAKVKVKIEIFDLLGKRIDELVNEILPAGNHKIELILPHLVSGVYFYKITAGSFVKTKKMILIK